MSKLATITTSHEVPDHASYYAQDASGVWTWFEVEPSPGTGHGDFWCSNGGDYGGIATSLPNPAWRDTLRKIDDPDWRRAE